VPEIATGISSPLLERKVVWNVSTMPLPPCSGLRMARITRFASSRLG
jgi:hypothetical protein